MEENKSLVTEVTTAKLTSDAQLKVNLFLSKQKPQRVRNLSAGFMGIKSPLIQEKTKRWHFSSHDNALMRAGINPNQFTIYNLPELKRRYHVKPKDYSCRISATDTSDVKLINTKLAAANTRKSSSRRKSMASVWEGYEAVDYTLFVEYLRNVKKYPQEYQSTGTRKLRAASAPTFRRQLSYSCVLAQNERSLMQSDAHLITDAAYSITTTAAIDGGQANKYEDMSMTELINMSELEKSKYSLLGQLSKLSTAQIIKLRESAIKEMGCHDVSVGDWSNSLRTCGYIRASSYQSTISSDESINDHVFI